MARFKISLQGEEKEVEVSQQGNLLRVSYDGLESELTLLREDGAVFALVRISPDGFRSRIRLAGWQQGNKRRLWVNGRTIDYEKVRQQPQAASGGGSLSSSIPAVVSKVLVAVGDTVTPVIN